jgi:hypothetical protein
MNVFFIGYVRGKKKTDSIFLLFWLDVFFWLYLPFLCVSYEEILNSFFFSLHLSVHDRLDIKDLDEEKEENNFLAINVHWK